jgi:tRNA/rRNA methyltransferase
MHSRLIVVLVRARNPSNIGAVSRAMHDLGYPQLRVVNDFQAPFEAAQLQEKLAETEAAKSAVHASSVLRNATQHASVADAVADCALVLGTTAVGDRVLEHPLHTLAEATPLVQSRLAAHPEDRVALLFGSEKTGLSNDELSHCDALLTIPMNNVPVPGEPARHLSMNLGQAAAVCLYTLAQPPALSLSPHLSFRGEAAESASPTPKSSTPAADLERLTQLLIEVLDRSGYTRRHPANSREPVIRRLVHRMGNTRADATVWAGILRQLLHALNQ